MSGPLDTTRFESWLRQEDISGANGALGHAAADLGETQIYSKQLAYFNRAVAGDPSELIKDRFLSRGGGMLLVAPTGLGKSSLSMQIMVAFAIGREIFGIRPACPLISLLVQAENDDGDLAEMRDGAYTGLRLDDQERRSAGKHVFVITENCRAGGQFFELLRSSLQRLKPDILWIDPALAFIEGDSNRADIVGSFLRRQLNPLLTEFGCGAVIVHHTPKPQNGTKGRASMSAPSAYAGSGSAEWSNWARAVLTLEPCGQGYFNLHNTKRPRLGWRDEFGKPAYSKLIMHCSNDGVHWWKEADLNQAEQVAMQRQNDAPDLASVVLRGVPHQHPIQKDRLEEHCRHSGISEKRFPKVLRGLTEQSPPLLFEWRLKRTGGKGGRDAIFIAHYQQPEDIVSVEDLTRPAG